MIPMPRRFPCFVLPICIIARSFVILLSFFTSFALVGLNTSVVLLLSHSIVSVDSSDVGATYV
ncbi:hypothetical protein BT69DRAFT_1278461 [Atractiella rhizophila]|nr:hypothetical protein BT69DRAFT_1278461 [Atractiella rhizophila]